MSTFAGNVVTQWSVAVAAPLDSQVNGIRLGAARLDSIATTSFMSGGAADLADAVHQAILHGDASVTLASLTKNVAGTSTITVASVASPANREELVVGVTHSTLQGGLNGVYGPVNGPPSGTTNPPSPHLFSPLSPQRSMKAR